jgi:hypothetical protein
MTYPQEQSGRGELPGKAVADGAAEVEEAVMGGSELLTDQVIASAELEGTVTGTAVLDAAVGTTTGVELLRRVVDVVRFFVLAARLTYPVELLSKYSIGEGTAASAEGKTAATAEETAARKSQLTRKQREVDDLPVGYIGWGAAAVKAVPRAKVETHASCQSIATIMSRRKVEVGEEGTGGESRMTCWLIYISLAMGRGIDGGFESGKSKRGVERERLGTDTNSSKSQGETLPNPGDSASLRQEVTACMPCMQIIIGQPLAPLTRCAPTAQLCPLSTSSIFSRRVGNGSSPSSGMVIAFCSTDSVQVSAMETRDCDHSCNEGLKSQLTSCADKWSIRQNLIAPASAWGLAE